MNHKANLNNYIDELISFKAKRKDYVYSLDINDLCDYEIDHLLALKLESIDRDTSECIHGLDFSIDNDFTCSLLQMLQKNTEEAKLNLAELMRNNMFAYFAEGLQELIDERCADYFSSRMISNGFGFITVTDDNYEDHSWMRKAC